MLPLIALLAMFPSESQPVPTPRIQLGGFLQKKIDGVVNHWLLKVPNENPAILDMFRDRDREPLRNLLPWSGEFAGKYLTAGTQVYVLTQDERLKARLQKFVGDLASLQAEDGYLGPFSKPDRLQGKARNVWGTGGDSWDVWGHYHAMVGLLLWHDATQDRKALDCAVKIGDLLCERFLPKEATVVSLGNPEMNQAIAHSLVLLHRETGTRQYLDLVEKIVKEFDADGAGHYLNGPLEGKEFYQLPRPRWESLHPIMAMAELQSLDRDKQKRQAFEELWWSIAKTDRHNNGGFTSGEQAQGNPYHQGPIETCCTIAWIAMSVEMYRLTGDPRVIDEIELSTLNQVVGLHAPDGSWCTYNTPMDGIRIPSAEDIAFQVRPGSEELNCCSVNAARGFGMLSDWFFVQNGRSLTLNGYGPSTVRASVEGVPVVLRQETNYPASGRVKVVVETDKPAEFELKLRIPHWSAAIRLKVNGETLEAKPGTYAMLDRQWKKGDVVELDLDMSPRFWAGEKECEGKSSVYLGPLLMALDMPGKGANYSKGWEQGLNMRTTRTAGSSVEFSFEGSTVRWKAMKFDDAGQARLTLDGKEIEVVDLFNEKRGVPFVWERTNLPPGAHTLKIEALGSHSEGSKGNWINVIALEPEPSLPSFTTKSFENMAEASIADAQRAVKVRDERGNEVLLRDFGTAGANRTPYASWLPISGTEPWPFSKENPSRTARGR
jgi:DUF1680 family protein